MRVPKGALQSRNPDPFSFLASHLTGILSIRILPRFCFIIPNPEPQISEIPDPEKPIEDPLISTVQTRRYVSQLQRRLPEAHWFLK